jgi:tetratricopeptide (TPR) repeat protein
MNRKTVIAGFIITGISLVITSVAAYLAPDLLGQPGGFLALFGGMFLAVTSLFGGGIREWAGNLFGKKEIHPEISRQINVGDNTTNVMAERFVQNIFQSETGKKTSIQARFTIPGPVKDFTGRDEQLEELKTALFSGIAVAAISGGGGLGKSELARKLADEIKESYPDTRLNIDLLGTSENPMSAEDAMRRLLEHFYSDQKLPVDPEKLSGLYYDTLSKQRVLLLLDNAASAVQVRPLIPPAPSATIITSRQHFSLTEFGLQEPLRLDVLSFEESRKFLYQASVKLNGFSNEKIDELSRLCGRLPLALRVAVSLLNDRPDWTFDTLLERLKDERTRLQRLKRLDDINLDIEATINLSYDLLSKESKKQFRMLGVFSAEFWDQPIAAVLNIIDEDDFDKAIGILVSRSLLNSRLTKFIQVSTNNIKTMNLYTFHDLTRVFALDRLIENSEDVKASTERHAFFYLTYANLAQEEYSLSNEHALNGLNIFRAIWPDLFLAWERMGPNQENWAHLDVATRWLKDFSFRFDDLLERCVPVRQRIAILEYELSSKTHDTESSNVVTDIDELKDNYVPIEAVNLNNLGRLYLNAGEARKSILLLEKALSVLQSSGHDSWLSYKYLKEKIIGNLGNAYARVQEYQKAIDCYEEQLLIATEIDDPKGKLDVLGNLGNTYTLLARYEEAVSYHEKQLVLSREYGFRLSEGDALGNMAVALSRQGKLDDAMKLREQALSIARDEGDRRREGIHLTGIGLLYDELGEPAKSIKFYEEGLSYIRSIGDRATEADTLVNFGTALKHLGEIDTTRKLWEEALSILKEIEDPRVTYLHNYIDKLDTAQNEVTDFEFTNMIVHTVFESIRTNDLKVEKHFEMLSNMARDSSLLPEIQELAKVLRKIVAGVKNPDLSNLPEEFAKLIRDELYRT